MNTADLKAALARHGGSVTAAICAEPDFAAAVAELVAKDPYVMAATRDMVRKIHWAHSEGLRPVVHYIDEESS